MKTKFFLATILSLFLFSNAWASPPGGAKMNEYMTKRYVTASDSGGTVFVDFRKVTKVTYMTHSVSNANYTI